MHSRRRIHQYRHAMLRVVGVLGSSSLMAACISSAGNANPAPNYPAGAPIARGFNGNLSRSAAIASLALPGACTEQREVKATGPEPVMPSGPQLLDSLTHWLEQGFPTIYGGESVGYLATTRGTSTSARSFGPKETIPSTIFISETEHDAALEGQAQAFRAEFANVVFRVSSRSWACLGSISDSIESGSPQGWGSIVSVGPDVASGVVNVKLTSCSSQAEMDATEWFLARYGKSVDLKFCQTFPSAMPGRIHRQARS